LAVFWALLVGLAVWAAGVGLLLLLLLWDWKHWVHTPAQQAP
jgi:hypothetical protein